MSPAELDAAGITAPRLRAAYTAARGINARHGRTYFLATRLLPPDARAGVHALYAFARHADDIVDIDPDRTIEQRASALEGLAGQLDAAIAGTPVASPVLIALADTVRRYQIDPKLFVEFLDAMRMDLRIAEYPDFPALEDYMRGSACAIGRQLLPVLGTVVPAEQAEPHADALGIAFQLTNFLRDVGEDLDRGRLYLPAAELAAFGVDRELLRWAQRSGQTDRRIRAALAHLVAHTRAVYRRALPGIELLRPAVRPCVATAFTLYQAILDEIEAVDYDVLPRRVSVPAGKRIRVALPGFLRAAWLR
ncbi:phytoene synthase [Tamaricihabitans halophyticus]|uniref:Phytoene synthase n=1 Tax=Tamaricihabitans halophyticus TaxID=1262583 RepID=A0A4R2R0P6_9PSEU|nr:phytoene/squalene synthase family protein [Tamaricihabitans halophyticus]TCP55139.1 phytoene synthase [Tamaricihabitans halophyticus]